METTNEPGHPSTTGEGAGRGHLVRWIALLTGLAGLVHLAAAWAHRDHATLLGLFLVAAGAQLVGAVALARRPRARVLIVLIALVNGAFVAFYLLTRMTGLTDVDGLEEAQAVGYGDLVAALLEGCVVVAALIALLPGATRLSRVAQLDRRGLAVLTTLALVLGGPAVVASAAHDGSHEGHGHDHGDDVAAGHDHRDGHGDDDHRSRDHDDDHEPGDDHGAGGHGDDGHGDDHASGTGSRRHGHSSGSGHDDDGHGPHGGNGPSHPGGHGPSGHDPGGHDPGGHDPGGHDPGGHDPGGHDPGGHDPGGHDPTFPSDWTPEQVAEAEALIASTEAALPAFRDPATIEALGFTWFGDITPGGYRHWINWDWVDDEHVLDPEHPESLVFRGTDDGLVLEAAMFILPSQYDMSTIPEDIAWLPGWHDHDNLCVDENRQFLGLAFGGTCSAGQLLEIPPMMHVWIVDTPCGRFAGVDEGGLNCHHEH